MHGALRVSALDEPVRQAPTSYRAQLAHRMHGRAAVLISNLLSCSQAVICNQKMKTTSNINFAVDCMAKAATWREKYSCLDHDKLPACFHSAHSFAQASSCLAVILLMHAAAFSDTWAALTLSVAMNSISMSEALLPFCAGQNAHPTLVWHRGGVPQADSHQSATNKTDLLSA